mgnify:CR=1 FL=1
MLGSGSAAAIVSSTASTVFGVHVSTQLMYVLYLPRGTKEIDEKIMTKER